MHFIYSCVLLYLNMNNMCIIIVLLQPEQTLAQNHGQYYIFIINFTVFSVSLYSSKDSSRVTRYSGCCFAQFVV